MKTKQILLVFILLSCKLLTAQSWQWAKSGGNNNKPAFIRLKEPKQKAEDKKENTTDKNALVIYPNPATNIANIKYTGMQQISITDAMGRTVYSKKTDMADMVQVNVSGFGKGMFFVRVTDSKGKVQTGKLIVQ